MTNPPTYIFDHSTGAEVKRLVDQARVIDPITERLLREAGIVSGMRVLDLGSGAGDVSFLVARIVGRLGAVVGLDSSSEAIHSARVRAQGTDYGNVTFARVDITAFDDVAKAVTGYFDAVIGRFILQFVPNPSQVVRDISRMLNPGGLMCFQEVDDWYTWSYPQTELWDQLRSWFLEALSGAGIEQRMGLRLYQAFKAAGLPGPALRLEAAIAGGQDAPASVWAGVIRAAVPMIERLGIATVDQIDPDSLTERLMADILAQDGVVIGPPMIGAWARMETST